MKNVFRIIIVVVAGLLCLFFVINYSVPNLLEWLSLNYHILTHPSKWFYYISFFTILLGVWECLTFAIIVMPFYAFSSTVSVVFDERSILKGGLKSIGIMAITFIFIIVLSIPQLWCLRKGVDLETRISSISGWSWDYQVFIMRQLFGDDKNREMKLRAEMLIQRMNKDEIERELH